MMEKINDGENKKTTAMRWPFCFLCPVLNMVYTFPPNKWRARWDKV